MSEVWYSIAPDGEHNYKSVEFPSKVTDLTVDEDGALVVVTETGITKLTELS